MHGIVLSYYRVSIRVLQGLHPVITDSQSTYYRVSIQRTTPCILGRNQDANRNTYEIILRQILISWMVDSTVTVLLKLILAVHGFTALFYWSCPLFLSYLVWRQILCSWGCPPIRDSFHLGKTALPFLFSSDGLISRSPLSTPHARTLRMPTVVEVPCHLFAGGMLCVQALLETCVRHASPQLWCTTPSTLIGTSGRKSLIAVDTPS